MNLQLYIFFSYLSLLLFLLLSNVSNFKLFLVLVLSCPYFSPFSMLFSLSWIIFSLLFSCLASSSALQFSPSAFFRHTIFRPSAIISTSLHYILGFSYIFTSYIDNLLLLIYPFLFPSVTLSFSLFGRH